MMTIVILALSHSGGTLCGARLKTHGSLVSKPPSWYDFVKPGAMRGYGAPQGFFALESHIDEIARRLNMDPLDFRRKNHVPKGDWVPITFEKILQALDNLKIK